jgi:hypothetical protein
MNGAQWSFAGRNWTSGEWANCLPADLAVLEADLAESIPPV